MWIEIKPTDDITILNDFASLRNEFGCAYTFTGEMVKNNMLNKVDCSYYRLDSDKYTILLGFKYDIGREKMTWMTFLILNCVEEDYPEALGELAKKTKEIMTIHNVGLLNEFDYHELEQYNHTFQFGYHKTLNWLKIEFEKIGLICEFNDNKCEVLW